MEVGLKVTTIDLAKAFAKAGPMQQAVKTSVTLAAREDTKRFVPYQDGALRATAETESRPEEGLLIWGNASVPYARAQYYGLPGKRRPGTVMFWFESAKAAFLKKWVQIAQKECERFAKL